jgi:hypothetical protein
MSFTVQSECLCAGDVMHVLHIVPSASAASGGDPIWFGGYEAPLSFMAEDEHDSVRTSSVSCGPFANST